MKNISIKALLVSALTILTLSLVSCGDPEARDGAQGSKNSPSGGSGSGPINGYLCHSKDTSNPNGGGSRFLKTAHFDGAGKIKYWEEYTTSNPTGGYGNKQPAASGTYTVNGDTINMVVGGENYQGRVNYRYNGQITEFYLGSELFGKALCD